MMMAGLFGAQSNDITGNVLRPGIPNTGCASVSITLRYKQAAIQMSMLNELASTQSIPLRIKQHMVISRTQPAIKSCELLGRDTHYPTI